MQEFLKVNQHPAFKLEHTWIFSTVSTFILPTAGWGLGFQFGCLHGMVGQPYPRCWSSIFSAWTSRVTGSTYGNSFHWTAMPQKKRPVFCWNGDALSQTIFFCWYMLLMIGNHNLWCRCLHLFAKSIVIYSPNKVVLILHFGIIWKKWFYW